MLGPFRPSFTSERPHGNLLNTGPQSESSQPCNTPVPAMWRLALPAGSRFGKGCHHLKKGTICSMPSTTAGRSSQNINKKVTAASAKSHDSRGPRRKSWGLA